MRNIAIIITFLLLPYWALIPAHLQEPLRGRIGIALVFVFTAIGHFVKTSEMTQMLPLFNEATGVSPKTLARSIRFDAIRNRLMFHPTAYLTELAYEKLLADALSEIRGEGLLARCYSFTCARDTGRHADHSLKGPIEGGFGCVAQSRGQFADVSTLLSQDRQRRIHPPARHITHDRFTEHLGEPIRK
jgi:hypothetical protein